MRSLLTSKRRQALCGVASFVECLMGKISCILLLQRMTLVCLLVCLLSFHNLDQRGRRVHSILCIRINDGFQQAYRIGVECNLTMKIHCTRFTLNTALYILSDILATMAVLFSHFFGYNYCSLDQPSHILRETTTTHSHHCGSRYLRYI